MLPSWISVSGGVRQWPSQSFANQRPFYKKFQSPERQHKSRFKIPFRALLLTCHCFVSGGQLNGLPLASSSSLAVYQSSSVTTIEYLLLVSCLGSLALGMDHPSWNANMKWSFPSISILVYQPLYFFRKMSSASPSREEWKIRLFLVSFLDYGKNSGLDHSQVNDYSHSFWYLLCNVVLWVL